MQTFAKIYAVSAVSLLLAACGGGGGGNHNDSASTPPANATTSFNGAVRNLAATDASPDAAASAAIDINTQNWQFDDSENAFADLFP